jgi:hypothetical protein
MGMGGAILFFRRWVLGVSGCGYAYFGPVCWVFGYVMGPWVPLWERYGWKMHQAASSWEREMAAIITATDGIEGLQTPRLSCVQMLLRQADYHGSLNHVFGSNACKCCERV